MARKIKYAATHFSIAFSMSYAVNQNVAISAIVGIAEPISAPGEGVNQAAGDASPMNRVSLQRSQPDVHNRETPDQRDTPGR